MSAAAPRPCLLGLALLAAAAPASAEPPVVEAAGAQAAGPVWTVSATLSHPDTGWEHYADGWRVETPSGEVLAVRDLLHPHETEQPFTRSLSGVAVPPELDHVMIRARCNLTGWSPMAFRLDLPD